MENHYETLGVTKAAEDVVIKAARTNLLQRYHPDRFTGNPDEALAKTTAINRAWDVLSDTKKRASYDAELADYEREMTAINLEQFSPKPARSSRSQTGFLRGLINHLALMSVIATVFTLNDMKLYSFFSSLACVGFGAILLSILMFASFESTQPKKDGRFKTGYKDNARLKPTPKFIGRLIINSIIICLIAFLVSVQIKPKRDLPASPDIASSKKEATRLRVEDVKSEDSVLVQDDITNPNDSAVPEDEGGKKIDVKDLDSKEVPVDPIKNAQDLLSH